MNGLLPNVSLLNWTTETSYYYAPAREIIYGCPGPTDREQLQLILSQFLPFSGHRSNTVVKVLCHKSEGPWFDPSWCYWKFSLT